LCAVTEGEDKPLKYPKAFANADLVLITKVDLLPYLKFDVALLEANIRLANATATILLTSSQSGAGLLEWYAYLLKATKSARARARTVELAAV